MKYLYTTFFFIIGAMGFSQEGLLLDNDGYQTRVAINNDGRVIEIHELDGASYYYDAMQAEDANWSARKLLDWYTGYPDISMNRNYVVEVHEGNGLRYNIGKLNSDGIAWRNGVAGGGETTWYSFHYRPSIVLKDNNELLTVSTEYNTVYYRSGKLIPNNDIKQTTIEWLDQSVPNIPDEITGFSGWYARVDMNDSGLVVVVAQDSENDPSFAKLLTGQRTYSLSGIPVITWADASKIQILKFDYVDGVKITRPDVSIDNEGNVTVVYNRSFDGFGSQVFMEKGTYDEMTKQILFPHDENEIFINSSLDWNSYPAVASNDRFDVFTIAQKDNHIYYDIQDKKACPESNYNLISQNGVDEFPQNCSIVTGDIMIHDFGTNSQIKDLSKLSNITSIKGGLYMFNLLGLTNLNGLGNIKNMNNLSITISPSLTTLEGFSNELSVKNNLSIYNNSNLKTCTQLCQILKAGEMIGKINIFNNAEDCFDENSLIDTCESITCLEENYTLTMQDQVDDFTKDHNCNVIQGYLRIIDGNISNLDGLSEIISIGQQLYISGNSSLTNIEGLKNVNSIGGYLEITNNPLLASLEGLQKIPSIGSNTINVFDNPKLSDCTQICALVESSTGYIDIIKNTGNCTTEDSLKEACAENEIRIAFEDPISDVYFYPNPTNGIMHFSENITSVIVTENFGQPLLSSEVKMINNELDLTNLANGVYHLRAIDTNGNIHTRTISIQK